MVTISSYALLPFYVIASAEFCSDCSGDAIESSRHKRIIYGSPLLDFKSFDVVGYFVHISMASGWSWGWYHFRSLLLESLHPIAGRQWCGGALLTPTIVQTACHCLTNRWTLAPHWEPKYHFPIRKNGWEDLMVLHHGYTRNIDFKDGVWSRKFINHLECKILNHTGELTHDFGLILTSTSFPEVSWAFSRGRNYNFAPVTTASELALQYYETMKREAVCLHVGFGKWYFTNKDLGRFGEASPILMHGWRSVRNYWECYIRTLKATHFLYGDTRKEIYKIYSYNYTQDCSWACTTFFGKQRAIDAPGDSGSPITCTNQYFGVMSFTSGILWSKVFGKGTTESVEMIGALGFSLFENAAEYRESMVARINEYATSNSDSPPGVPDHSTVDPFNPNAYYHSTKPAISQFAARSHSMDIHGTSITLIAVLQLVIIPYFIL